MTRTLLLFLLLCFLPAHGGEDYPCTIPAGRYFLYQDPEWPDYGYMLARESDGETIPNWRSCALSKGFTLVAPIVDVEPPPPPQKPPFSFDMGKYDLSPEAQRALAPVVKFFQGHPEIKLVRIEGHADLSEVTTPEAALALSTRRAEMVRDFILSQGVAAERMETVGYGATRPVTTENTPEAQAMNRRVDFVVVKRADSPPNGKGG